MPLEITTRIIKSAEIKSRKDGAFEVELPYKPIFQWGYGRMDLSAPGKGLATSGVASCTVVVLHCHSTNRTVVTHSPNRLYMNTFVPMIDYITGGEGNQLSIAERVAWKMGFGSSKVPIDIDAVVLRGSTYADPVQARRFGHDNWMSDFRELFDGILHTRAITANIVDSSRILSAGTVLIDKGTGRISYVSVGAARSSMRLMEFLTTPSYNENQRHQDLFVGSLEGCEGECIDIRLQWDVDHYCLSAPLTNLARELLRSRSLDEPKERQSALLRAASMPDFISSSSSGKVDADTVLKMLWAQYALRKTPCERCGDEGLLKCSSCRGAWYCGKVHQKEDWKFHKEWCKGHKWASES